MVVEFIQGLIQFSEDALGRHSAEPSACMRIPASLIIDARPLGSLHCILEAAVKRLGERNFKTDFRDPSKREFHISLVVAIRRTLAGRFKLPRYDFFVGYLNEEDQASVTELAAKLGARVIEGTEEGSASHVLYPTDTHALVEGNEMFCRTLEKKDDKSRVHWWYRPDSYDEWVPNENVSGEPEDENAKKTTPYRIEKRFIDDSKLYNEWMNELDYEVDEKAVSSAKLGGKRAIDGIQEDTPAAKKLKSDIAQENEGTGGNNAAFPGSNNPGVGVEVEANQGKLLSEDPRVAEQQVKATHTTVENV